MQNVQASSAHRIYRILQKKHMEKLTERLQEHDNVSVAKESQMF